ncbi:YjzD family protein [Bacillus spongiae]|uniref:YjzD family protein n=1 Tax=Bacillus spongiae TaxID=2683610 RepID=A0ABU8HB20_9BACI
MRYFWTFFWTLLLVEMLSYVVSSMNGIEFNPEAAAILAVITTLLLFVVSAVIPNDSVEEH